VKVIDAFESQPEEDGGVREERVRRGGEWGEGREIIQYLGSTYDMNQY
jgi:hypothetical protein